jgi:hypothetical protein
MNSYEKIPYYFGESPISKVILNGKYYCWIKLINFN